MRAHLVQLDIAWEDKASNHRRVESLVSSCGVERGDLVVLPEMFDTGFSLNVETTGADAAASMEFLRGLARRTGTWVVGGITVIGEDGRGRNRAMVYGPGGDEAARYDKVHPFSYGREPERFAGGREVAAFDWVGEGGGGLRVCPVVCYDLRFPELFRAGLGVGAEMFVVIANWPRARAGHWRSLLVARAIENQAYVVGVNRSGEDPHLSYAGGSMAVDPKGRVVAEAGEEEGVWGVEVDPGAVGAWREEFPAWRDGRFGVVWGGDR